MIANLVFFCGADSMLQVVDHSCWSVRHGICIGLWAKPTKVGKAKLATLVSEHISHHATAAVVLNLLRSGLTYQAVAARSSSLTICRRGLAAS